MAAMAALQSSLTSLSLSSNSFLGQRLSPPTLYAVPVPYPTSPRCLFSIFFCSVAFKLILYRYIKAYFDFIFLKLLFFVGNMCFKIVAFFSNFLCYVAFYFMLGLGVAIMVVFPCFISLLVKS